MVLSMALSTLMLLFKDSNKTNLTKIRTMKSSLAVPKTIYNWAIKISSNKACLTILKLQLLAK